ncbi:MAG: hypothetical protein JWR89_2890 [Tardiphaga sp.]|jgi:hypothetical protein|uniref:hypothetical protein n=1 Tax=Tardiphaga sp. TaxID=1926292 RepID=UPI0026100FE7|nr:hypothetical protein [Tardiphaga sp.]MDB5502988.1 hypothetical protein [Tardiphaga sp.]
MLPDGRYSVWFRTAEADGVGLVEIADQRLIGRDTVIEYSGSFIQNGNRFTAKVSTRRHAPGQPSILGIDELDFEFAGTSSRITAACSGRILQMPDVPLEVVLLRVDG